MEKIIKISLCLVATAIISLSIWIYFAFCKFDQIYVGIEGAMPTKQDTIYHKKMVLGHYDMTLFICKGNSFENILCHELENKTKRHVAQIDFNWDNSITCMIDKNKYTLKVDSINIATCCIMPFDTITWEHGSDDSVFYSVAFYDEKKNMIEISRQKTKFPYGGKRHGFWIKIGDKNIVTGNTSPFDY